MERWRAGHGNELIEKYGILDDSDPDQDAEAEDPRGRGLENQRSTV